MSGQICRYYLKGICKYGSRCHFLHSSVDPNYKENYPGYSNVNYYDKYYSNKVSHVPAQDYGCGNNYDKNSSTSYNRSASNYSRYHVDNRRYNQTEIKSTSLLTEDEILEVIQQELREFEERHIWYFSVIAPLRDLGNIPGFKDLSPEELRFQFYESSLNNSLPDFVQNLNMAKNDVTQVRQIFLNKSARAYEIVRSITQKSVSSSGEEMTTDYPPNSASAFKFDLNSLNQSSCFPTQSVQSQCQFSQMPEVLSVGNSLFPAGNFSNFSTDFLLSQPSQSAGFDSAPTNDMSHQPNTAMNSFSFSLNQLQLNQSNYSSNINSSISEGSKMTVNSDFTNKPNNANGGSSVFSNSTSIALMRESIYSKPDQIPHDALTAFQAKSFKIGSIPLIAPSEELCFK